jgi:predicted MFS family arabinose efflux permease
MATPRIVRAYTGAWIGSIIVSGMAHPEGSVTGSRAPLWTPAFIGLSLAELAYFTANGVAIPVVPLFAAGPLGGDEFGVGLAVGAFSATGFVLRPVAGRASDSKGRRPLMVGGGLLYAVVTAAMPFVPDLTLLVLLRLLLGIAEAFFFVAGFAAVADLAPPGRAGEALSFNSLSLYLGIAFGPLLGEALLDAGGFGLALFGGAGLSLLAALLALRLPETRSSETSETPPAPLVHPAAIGPGLALFAGISAMSGFYAFVTLYARDLGLEGSRLILLEFGLIVVGGRIAFSRLPDKVPPFRLGTFALGVGAIGLIVIAVTGSVAGLIAGAALLAIGVTFMTPALFAAIVARVAPSQRGAALGTASAFIDLGFGGGPILLGIVANSSGIPAAFVVGAMVAALGSAGTAIMARRRVPAAS